MIDAHCHLNFKAFESDYDQVIKKAESAGVHTIINVGTQVSSSIWAVNLADKYDCLYAIVGVHPHHADKTEQNWLNDLEKLTRHPKVIAIGEIGLDYYQYNSNGIVEPIIQKKIFEAQIELAHRAGLPLQIHNRLAGGDILQILQNYKNLLQDPPGMFHCFAGSLESLKSALQMGFYVGFDGNITYKGLAPGETVSLSTLVKHAPIDRIIIETDSPYLSPVPHRGQRNEPKNAIITGEYIAELKKVSFEKLAEQTDRNVYAIFNKIKKRFKF